MHREPRQLTLRDRGANWVHGASEQNPIYRLARKTKSVLWERIAHFAGYDESGAPIPETRIEEASEAMFGIMHRGEEYSRQHMSSIPASKSVWEYFLEEARKAFRGDSDRTAKEKLLLQSADMLGGYVAGALDTQSLRFLWLQQGLEGDDMFNASSYKTVLEAIAQPALSKATILRQHRVSRITSTKNQGRPAVEIQAANNHTDLFDAVVVTLPLGALQRQKQALFQPSIPADLATSIDAIGYGNLDKVIISFPRAFWDTTDSGKDDKVGAIDFFHPGYATDTNPKQWSLLSMNLASLPEGTQQPTLLFYIYGACANHIAELVDKTAPADRLAVLSDWFRPYYSRLPNYDAADPQCQPVDALSTQWTSDELAGYGSYSNFPVGVEAADKDIERMAAGMPERGVFLAGEHTAVFEALGTVHGAYWSGERAAKQVLKQHGIDVHIADASL